jgi:hypothetical protein
VRSPVADGSKDLDDVVALLRVHRDGIDTMRVRTVLSMLEQALGQSDLISAFGHCQARARS